MVKRKGVLAVVIIIAVIIIDQIIKISVKTSMCLHENIHVFDWFYISFVENNGAAFGMEIFGKLFLSLFRIILIGVVGYYLMNQVKKNARMIYITLLALVIAGAAGNLIDCIFYGLIFSPSTPYDVAQFVPFGEGYSTVLMGKVVDMLYFPLIETTWPTWVPIVGGQYFVFFSPVFNFADSCITCSVILLLIFCRPELQELSLKGTKDNSQEEIQPKS